MLQPLATVHFDPPLNFLDLFLPGNLASYDRARAFLWLIFHYLEDADAENPFDDDYSRKHRHLTKIPWIRRLTEAEQKLENVDTPEEVEWGNKMSAQRNVFLHKLVTAPDTDKKGKGILASQKGSIHIFPTLFP
jgi:Ino eighty subunit 1